MKPLLALAALVALPATPALAQQFAVANRAGGDLTVFDPDGAVLHTVPLPAATHPPEPMFIVQVGDEVVVGDRANDRVVRFDKSSWAPLGSVAVGAGVAHMAADRGQLWVAGEIADAVTVLDTSSWTTLATVPVPPALVAQGYMLHDVVLGRGSAFVSLSTGMSATDRVLRIDRSTFAVETRAAVPGAPHICWSPRHATLYVACHTGDEVVALAWPTLRLVDRLPLPGAHGLCLASGADVLLSTQLTTPTGARLVAVHLRPDGRFGAQRALATPFPLAHHVASSASGDRIFVTHSGGGVTEVSIYTFEPTFRLLTTAVSGPNPWGVARID